MMTLNSVSLHYLRKRFLCILEHYVANLVIICK